MWSVGMAGWVTARWRNTERMLTAAEVATNPKHCLAVRQPLANPIHCGTTSSSGTFRQRRISPLRAVASSGTCCWTYHPRQLSQLAYANHGQPAELLSTWYTIPGTQPHTLDASQKPALAGPSLLPRADGARNDPG